MSFFMQSQQFFACLTAINDFFYARFFIFEDKIIDNANENQISENKSHERETGYDGNDLA